MGKKFAPENGSSTGVSRCFYCRIGQRSVFSLTTNAVPDVLVWRKEKRDDEKSEKTLVIISLVSNVSSKERRLDVTPVLHQRYQKMKAMLR